MGLFIKNAGVEQAARELARLQKKSLTEAVGEAVQSALAAEQAKPRRKPTLEEMIEATERFRRAVGLDKRKVNATRADFDALWDIPELAPKDDAH
jgi:antitoxin VapB